MRRSKGFTLVELLAVIVILAIIMIIAIPTVLDIMQSTRRKTFLEYIDKIENLSKQKYMERDMELETSYDECVIYNIEKDLDLSNVGKFKGYILISTGDDDDIYYVSLWNDEYMIAGYNLTGGVNKEGVTKKLEDSLEPYNETKQDELKPSALCSYACSSCVYNSGEIVDLNDDSEDNIPGGNVNQNKTTTLIDGVSFNQVVSTLAGESSKCRRGTSNCTNLKEIRRATKLKQGVHTENISSDIDNSQRNPVYVWFENGILYFYTTATKIQLNSDSGEMFDGFRALTNMSEFISSVYSDEVTIMNEMFYNCHSLDTLNLRHFNTSKVISMSDLFGYCTSLSNLDISSFNTSRVEIMNYMFQECTSLTSLDLSHFNTQNLVSMDGMFEEDSGLLVLNVSTWDTSKVEIMRTVFVGCSSLTNLDISKWNTQSVISMKHMFAYCSSLTSLNVSNWNTRNVEIMEGLFKHCESLTSIDVSKWNTQNVTTMQEMFDSCFSLANLTLTSFNTGNVTTFADMFEHCESLTQLNLTSFNTSKATIMSNMFRECSNLRKIIVKTFDVSHVTESIGMFEGDTKLPNFDSAYEDKTRAYVGSRGYLSNR